MMTLHRMSAGTGYEYLLRHVARGDVDQVAVEGGAGPLAGYYARTGYPAGRWLGSGVADLEGEISVGDEVTEMQLANLLGEGRDPNTGAPLGRAFPVLGGLRDRIEARVSALDASMPDGDRVAAVEAIEEEERARRSPVAVAGFDCTFSPAKSVSALWAVAPADVQRAMWEAHHDAVEDVIGWLEDEAAFTRTGHAGIAQIDTMGLIATAFDHHDTRSGDPQMHTHVVIANRVMGIDGRWRTLDSRVLHRSAVAASELYDSVLADRLTQRLGVDWEHQVRRVDGSRDRETAGFEIVGVPAELIAEFTSRSEQIRENLDDLVVGFRAERGREPKGKEWIVLRQRATLMERPQKEEPRPFHEAVASWRERAERVLGSDPSVIVSAALGRRQTGPGALLTAADVTADSIAEQATLVVTATSLRRSTWTLWNLYAEAARQTRTVRFASPQDRLAVLDSIADAAAAASVSLDPPEVVEVPASLRRSSGESVFSVHGEARFSSQTILDAEEYLLVQSHDRARGQVAAATLEAVIGQGVDGMALSDDQAAAVRQIASSGRGVEVLIGPAGTGKTTTLQALSSAWSADHGSGSVIGLAPSAAAAEVLAQSLGIDCENTAKWLHESAGDGYRIRRESIERLTAARTVATNRGGRLSGRATAELDRLRGEDDRWSMRPGQLVIVDEASLAGTLSLAGLARQAEAAGARLLLVGDHGQLTAVDAGGALGLLAHDTGAAELSSVWRFRNEWERAASLGLRRGAPSALDEYEARGRVHEGDATEMLDAAYQAWLTDTSQGRSSLLIAADNATVDALNTRARLDLAAAGQVEVEGISLPDGSTVGTGDRIVTRRNDRALRAGDRWVRNGDIWTVTARHDDGALSVTRASTDTQNPASVRLPADYVREHVSLAYATTIHRAQGATVDTAHALISPTTAREGAYVAATRGRDANHLYAVIGTGDEDHGHTLGPASGREVLEAVLARSDAELSATETLRRRYDAATSTPHLCAVYDHIAQAGADQHWGQALRTIAASLPGTPQDAADQLGAGRQWPALAQWASQAAATGVDVSALAAVTLVDHDWLSDHDPTTVLAAAIRTAALDAARTGREPARIAGLWPRHQGHTPGASSALDQVAQLLEAEATATADTAINENQPWVTAAAGPLPTAADDRRHWYRRVVATAAYRNRWSVTDPGDTGLDKDPDDRTQRRDQRRLTALLTTAEPSTSPAPRRSDPTPPRRGPTRTI